MSSVAPALSDQVSLKRRGRPRKARKPPSKYRRLVRKTATEFSGSKYAGIKGTKSLRRKFSKAFLKKLAVGLVATSTVGAVLERHSRSIAAGAIRASRKTIGGKPTRRAISTFAYGEPRVSSLLSDYRKKRARIIFGRPPTVMIKRSLGERKIAHESKQRMQIKKKIDRLFTKGQRRREEIGWTSL